MWKETAVRMLVGIGGMALGALFVLGLRGAAQADADRLQLAHSAALAAAPSNEEIASLSGRKELPARRVP